MSSIFQTRNNIGVTDKKIGRVMFAQILDDAIEESQRGDRILIAYTLQEPVAREVIRHQDEKYFVTLERIANADHLFKLNTFNVSIHLINVMPQEDLSVLLKKMIGYQYDKIIVADASWVSKEFLVEISNRCRSANGRDREAVTFITSGTGYKNDEVNEMIKDPSSARWGIPIHVFDYNERSVR